MTTPDGPNPQHPLHPPALDSWPPRDDAVPAGRDPRRWSGSLLTEIIHDAIILIAGVALGLLLAGPKTPEECGQALTHAEEVMGLDNQGFTLAGEALTAAAGFDTATVNAKAAEIRALTPKKATAAGQYAAAAATCRGK